LQIISAALRSGKPWQVAALAMLTVTAAVEANAAGRAVAANSVLMISVDGMRPDYVTQADAHGLKIPFLRGLLREGCYAQGVTGVWPTVTYPSHVTLVTGVAPAEHGIYNNLEFDPRHQFAESWYWYAAQIRVPTLWQVARRAGLATASVGWPATVGAADVDFLIPEYWRIFHPTADLNPSDRHLMAALSRPEGMLVRMQASLGPYLMGNDVSRDADEIKTRFALSILAQHKPRLMTVHLSSLDEQEHAHGPFSDQANADLEAIDEMLARLSAGARAADPKTITVVVSDHGFAALTHRVNLLLPFIKAGLLELHTDPATHATGVVSWDAQPWLAGGMAAVILRDPDDPALAGRVRRMLEELSHDPQTGIAALLERDDIAKRGAFPGASFLIVMKSGYYTGAATDGVLVTDMTDHGGHGFAPDDPDMRAAFFAAGQGVAQHRDLGLIDMRRIAPTLARWLGVPMPSAAAPPLSVAP
jgi:predicted AlkP superfamily pyrophosphatase or phosphodiesterase